MITLRIYHQIEYTTASMPGGLWRWTCYPKGLIGPKHEGVVAGSEAAAAQACRAAIDAIIHNAKAFAAPEAHSDGARASSHH